jgi:hypothetical protein
MAAQPSRRVLKAAEVDRAHIHVIHADFSQGYPTGAALYYECLACGDFVPSFPDRPMGCQCGNIFMDVDAGRLSVKDGQRLRLVELPT